MFWKKNKKRKIVELYPDELLLDIHNLPNFDRQQLEGRLERPIAQKSLFGLFAFMIVIAFIFVGRLSYLQIVKGAFYATKSEQNSLDHSPIIADRGVIYDRNEVELSWNKISTQGLTERSYIKSEGFANLLGYVSYPAKDDSGQYWQNQMVGKDGAEQQFNEELSGKNGTNLIETNVSGSVISQNIIDPPVQGENIKLSIDYRIQEALFEGIKSLAEQSGYQGGAGAVMDIKTGELLAFTTYPQYDQEILSNGGDAQMVNKLLNDSRRPFIDRMTQGLYTPGSIVKPFIALAALKEGVITPEKIIYTTGSLKIPNPYNPGKFTIFNDNANHGAVDMRKAIAVSSNVYFYQIGGGFENQRGLGIDKIDQYMDLFGIGKPTGTDAAKEIAGIIPSIDWKKKNFPGDPWRVGDTYNTSIGQYGFQVTPIQMLRAVAGIASEGILVTPTIKFNPKPQTVASLDFSSEQYSVVKEGMRRVVLEGTARSLNNENIHVAAKTGTAQIKNNTRVNSWALGFLPYENPKYAFVVLMENGPRVSSGATNAFKPVLNLLESTPELLTE